MEILDIPCRRDNYGGLRGQPIEFLVIHYTANNGDTARDNGRYFSDNAVGTSAHYFVDERQAVRSVPEDYVAWHCGGSLYRHPTCRNGNSIGVELCSRRDETGQYFFRAETVANAQTLVRDLMVRHRIPTDRVLRHYDVTGKLCPAPFVGAGKDAWNEFLGGLMMYQTWEQTPDWARPTVKKLVEQGILQGDAQGQLNLSYDLVRTLVLLDRAGIWSKEE